MEDPELIVKVNIFIKFYFQSFVNHQELKKGFGIFIAPY